MQDAHKISVDELCKRVDSSKEGLTTETAKKRLSEYGPNILQSKKKYAALVLFLKQFTNFFALLLTAGSILAFLAEYLSPGQGNLYIGIALIGVVILNAIFTFIQHYESEKIMDSFKKMIPKEIDIIRDAGIQRISSEEIVPGDVICLSEGRHGEYIRANPEIRPFSKGYDHSAIR